MLNFVLVVVLGICVVTDGVKHMIYNAVVLPACLFAFVFHTLIDGWTGLFTAFSGLLTGIAILFIPFALGGMGGGDVKLLGMIGAFKGTVFVLTTAIYMGIVGGLLGMLLLFFRQHPIKQCKLFCYSFLSVRNGLSPKLFFAGGSLSTVYPYGIAVAGGAFCTMVLKGWPFL